MAEKRRQALGGIFDSPDGSELLVARAPADGQRWYFLPIGRGCAEGRVEMRGRACSNA